MMTTLKVFFQQALLELKKVTWPKRRETVAMAIGVVASVVVLSFVLLIVDSLCRLFLSFILG